MRELEEQFAEELTVIGVHSGKFIAERETPRIADAMRRLGVAHPVVNDRQFRIWRNYAVRAWPTIVVIDPNGYVLGMHAGEFTAAMVAPTVEEMIAAADDTVRRGTTGNEKHERSPTALRYPGKVAVSGARIAIADSGNDRIVVADLNGTRSAHATINAVYGGERGYRDGADGEFLVKSRAGAKTTDVLAWRSNPAVPKADSSGKASYRLAIRVGADSVHFLVNDKQVAALKAGTVATDGVAGLRINHNLHVTTSPIAIAR